MNAESSKVNAQLESFSASKRQMLLAIKQQGMACATTLATSLGLTREACRQQLKLLAEQGLVESHSRIEGAGRPRQLFMLSNAGEHLFPKHYDLLSVQLIDTMQETLGAQELKSVLGAISSKQVAQWQAKVEGLSLRERLEVLKDFYFANDPFIELVEDERGLWLVEKNCPFLNLANARPALCSVTVSTLMRLLGVRVVREKRFQQGDGHCAFHILVDEPVAADFVFEFELEL